MDLLQTVRKEGSRGGRTAFSWDDVKTDAHRENYLGHSLMAPVGRWQKSKDLSWYTRSGDANVPGDEAQRKAAEAEVRRDEIRRVKEAEEDALALALGYDVPDRTQKKGADGVAGNPNMTKLGDGGGKETMKAVKEGIEGDDEDNKEGGRGLGFGSYGGAAVGIADDDEEDVLEGTGLLEQRSPRDRGKEGGKPLRDTMADSRRRDDRHRPRSRSRGGDRDREKRHSRRHETEHSGRHSNNGRQRRRHEPRSRSRSRSRVRQRRSRSREGRDRDYREAERRGGRHNDYERHERHERKHYDRGDDSRSHHRRNSNREPPDSDRGRTNRDKLGLSQRTRAGLTIRDSRETQRRERSRSPGDYRSETRDRRRYS